MGGGGGERRGLGEWGVMGKPIHSLVLDRTLAVSLDPQLTMELKQFQLKAALVLRHLVVREDIWRGGGLEGGGGGWGV